MAYRCQARARNAAAESQSSLFSHFAGCKNAQAAQANQVVQRFREQTQLREPWTLHILPRMLDEVMDLTRPLVLLTSICM